MLIYTSSEFLHHVVVTTCTYTMSLLLGKALRDAGLTRRNNGNFYRRMVLDGNNVCHLFSEGSKERALEVLQEAGLLNCSIMIVVFKPGTVVINHNNHIVVESWIREIVTLITVKHRVHVNLVRLFVPKRVREGLMSTFKEIYEVLKAGDDIVCGALGGGDNATVLSFDGFTKVEQKVWHGELPDPELVEDARKIFDLDMDMVLMHAASLDGKTTTFTNVDNIKFSLFKKEEHMLELSTCRGETATFKLDLSGMQQLDMRNHYAKRGALMQQMCRTTKTGAKVAEPFRRRVW